MSISERSQIQANSNIAEEEKSKKRDEPLICVSSETCLSEKIPASKVEASKYLGIVQNSKKEDENPLIEGNIYESNNALVNDDKTTSLAIHNCHVSSLSSQDQIIESYVDIKDEPVTISDNFYLPQSNDSSFESASDNTSTHSSTSTDDSSSENEECVEKSTHQNHEFDNPNCALTNKPKMKVLRVEGEILNCELPLIEDLHITVPEHECIQFGTVTSIVDDLVVVKSLPNTPALDIDSVLFLDKGKKTLGKIFDVIGPVKNPSYCIRFNSNQHIKENEINVQMEVFCAPRTEHTSYIFVEQLRRMKGTDASWKDNVEPNAENFDYSDDEQERLAKRNSRNNGMETNNDGPFVEKVGVNKRRNNTRETRGIKRGGRVYRPAKPAEQSQNPFYRSRKPRGKEPARWNSLHYNNEKSNGFNSSFVDPKNIQTPWRIPSPNHFDCNSRGTVQTSFANQAVSFMDFSQPPPPIAANNAEGQDISTEFHNHCSKDAYATFIHGTEERKTYQHDANTTLNACWPKRESSCSFGQTKFGTNSRSHSSQYALNPMPSSNYYQTTNDYEFAPSYSCEQHQYHLPYSHLPQHPSPILPRISLSPRLPPPQFQSQVFSYPPPPKVTATLPLSPPLPPGLPPVLLPPPPPPPGTASP